MSRLTSSLITEEWGHIYEIFFSHSLYAITDIHESLIVGVSMVSTLLGFSWLRQCPRIDLTLALSSFPRTGFLPAHWRLPRRQ